MAVRTFRLGTGLDGVYGALFEADQTAASRTDGWTVGKVAATNVSQFVPGTKQTVGTFTIDPVKPETFSVGTAPVSALRTPSTLTGTFAATDWTFTFAVRATTASSQRGRVRLRVFKDTRTDGLTATNLTGGTNSTAGTTSLALSTTADVTTVVTWSPGALTFTNEYLFVLLAWEITTASGSNSGDVVFRTGQSAAGTRIVTPDLSAGGTTYTKAGYARESA